MAPGRALRPPPLRVNPRTGSRCHMPLRVCSGGSGIRTHGTRWGSSSFQDCRLRPLGHPSEVGLWQSTCVCEGSGIRTLPPSHHTNSGCQPGACRSCGGSGIRTHGTGKTGPTVFETAAFVRSAIPPRWDCGSRRAFAKGVGFEPFPPPTTPTPDASPARAALAEGVGFEPTGPVKPAQQFSRLPPSSARPSLRAGRKCNARPSALVLEELVQ